MKKICLLLSLVFLLSLCLSSCDGLVPSVDDDFYFGGDITPDTSRRPDDTEIPDAEPDAGIGENTPSDLPYLPV